MSHGIRITKKKALAIACITAAALVLVFMAGIYQPTGSSAGTTATTAATALSTAPVGGTVLGTATSSTHATAAEQAVGDYVLSVFGAIGFAVVGALVVSGVRKIEDKVDSRRQ